MTKLLVVMAAGTLLSAVIIVLGVANQSTQCCGTSPYASIFRQEHPLSRIDATLAKGDGQAFAAIARDPLLSRPKVLATPEIFAYREQRPLWGYLAWALSLGQAPWVGIALAVLTALSVGAACAVTAFLLLERGLSPGWSLLVPIVGLESLSELTPELLAFALLGLGIVLWQRQRTFGAVLALSAAALTRETMLIAVAALGLWLLFEHPRRASAAAFRAVVPLSIPLCAYAIWITFVRVRIGAWPSGASQGRFALPGTGLAQAVIDRAAAPTILPWLLVGLIVTVGSVCARPARRPDMDRGCVSLPRQLARPRRMGSQTGLRAHARTYVRLWRRRLREWRAPEDHTGNGANRGRIDWHVIAPA